jgi:hypothetical protein
MGANTEINDNATVEFDYVSCILRWRAYGVCGNTSL